MTAITKLDRIDLGFNARESDKIDATARMLFDRSRVRPEVAAAMGAARPGSLGAADYETIRAHVAFCTVIQRAHRITIDPVALWGKDRVEIAAIGAARAAGRKRGAGARAVANNYGDEFVNDPRLKHGGLSLALPTGCRYPGRAAH